MKKVGELDGIDVLSSDTLKDDEFYLIGQDKSTQNTLFKPRPFQQKTIDRIQETEIPTLLWPPQRNYRYGIDLAGENVDQSVITMAVKGHKSGLYVFDEFSTMPNYKWYRNPIKWWRWRQLIKSLEKSKWDLKVDTSRAVSKDNYFKNWYEGQWKN